MRKQRYLDMFLKINIGITMMMRNDEFYRRHIPVTNEYFMQFSNLIDTWPSPPPTEQYRIVAKVDTLMALCDTLEARLKERAGVQGRFANAGVKQVAGGV